MREVRRGGRREAIGTEAEQGGERKEQWEE